MTRIHPGEMEVDGVPLAAPMRQLLAAANVESEHLRHQYVGTEHVVLALASGSSILARTGIGEEQVRTITAKYVIPGANLPKHGITRLYTARTQRALLLAAESARGLGRDSVAIEDVLLGLMRERANIGAVILHEAGLSLEQANELAQRPFNHGTSP